jgi:DUF4097 and DUF4098 domain-containing protein YvlB
MKVRLAQVGLLGGLVLLVLLHGGCIYIDGICSNCSSEKTLDVQAPMEGGTQLKVHTPSGSIHIKAGQSRQCSGVAKVRVQAPSPEQAEEIAEQVRIDLVPSAGQLEIKPDYPKLHHISVSISYELTVPVQTSVLADTASGSIHLAGLNGDITAHTASGSISVEDIAQGQADLATASGGIRVDNAVLTALWMKTASGSIRCEQISCPQIKGHTSSGGIRVICSPDGPAELTADLSTSSGSVQLDAPEGFAGQVEMSTQSGSVSSDLPITVRGKLGRNHLAGTVGQGSGHISLHTSSGSVKLY